MKGNLIVGGAYFSDDRLDFMQMVRDSKMFNILHVDWEIVKHGGTISLPDSDFNFVFGMKKWSRKLRKSRMTPKEVIGKISGFVNKSIPNDRPLVVLEDFNDKDERDYGKGLRKFFLGNTDCRAYLLREYWTNTGEKYSPLVHPFSICCNNNDEFLSTDKDCDLYFRGDDSSPDRKKILRNIRKFKDIDARLKVYSGGEKSPEKLPRDEFMKNLARSRFCLSFAGHGYCTFRYQEIASVGSIIVTPKYPWKVHEDYEDMVSCVKFETTDELQGKLTSLLKDDEAVKRMAKASFDNFKNHHSTEARFKQMIEHIERSTI